MEAIKKAIDEALGMFNLLIEGSEPLEPELFEKVEEFSHEAIQRVLG